MIDFSLRHRKAEFVFQYLLDGTHSQDGMGNYRSLTLASTTTYDDDLAFVCSFGDAFPGQQPDQNHDLASRRLRRFLNILSEDGWLRRWRCSNHDIDRHEPSWQYVYDLPQWLVNDLKTGKLTLQTAATVWAG